jgi:hypothetical protein
MQRQMLLRAAAVSVNGPTLASASVLKPPPGKSVPRYDAFVPRSQAILAVTTATT